MDEIHVIKLDGNKEIFSPEKLRQSLARSGAAPDVADSIVVHIAGEVREGMTTSHIYKHALDLIKKRS